jgi:DNA-binding XRE family transcriptional regulator
MNRLYDLLLDHGIKQSRLALTAGLSKETINRICKNRAQGQPVTQTNIVKALNKLTGCEYTKQDVFQI